MNVLILGSGAREHTLAWKISQSPLLTKLYCAPGNPGTATCATNLPINLSRFDDIKQLVLQHHITMVVVGPEEPLVNGIVDYFAQDKALSSCFVVGPSRKGARLEGSKDFAKSFMKRHHIPTAPYASFTASQVKEGIAFLRAMAPPNVLKADGLAAGKGVIIARTLQEAEAEFCAMLNGKFGEAGNRVVIEAFLSGIELSVFFITDGKSYKILPEAKDYKRIGENDTGLNTGGMGAVSPVPFANQTFMQKVEEQIIAPTVDGLAAEGIDYKGFVFVGLMNCHGEPYVIEYNVRLGDPETEVILPRIQSDFLALLGSLSRGSLAQEKLMVTPHHALSVVMASGGYPQAYQKGFVVNGLEDVRQDVLIFHAGTSLWNDRVVTSGGRVLAVTAMDATLEKVRNNAYQHLESIEFENACYRRDIGVDLLRH